LLKSARDILAKQRFLVFSIVMSCLASAAVISAVRKPDVTSQIDLGLRPQISASKTIETPPFDDENQANTRDVKTEIATKAYGITYYVDSINGNDINLGTAPNLAFKTIQQANQKVAAGDIIYVKNGIYYEDVTIQSSGSPGRWITFQAFPGHRPIIIGNYQAFKVLGSYIKIIGFEVTAKAENGIAVGGAEKGNHHTQIMKNVIHDSGCNAIGGVKTDYLLISDNTVYRNAFTAPWQCSGISIYQAVASDHKPGFHNIIRKNISYSNENKSPRSNGMVTDGNGIIIDDFRHSQNKQPHSKYTARTLIENNIVFDNGGRGIHIFQSDNVVVRNNTTFHNLKSNILEGTLNGELATYFSSKIIFYNNIAYAQDKSKKTFSDGYSTGNLWDYNLSFNGQISVGKDNSNARLGRNNLIDLDPLFVNASIIASTANFRLRPNSPALNSGISGNAPRPDIDFKERLWGAKHDIGANAEQIYRF
jgi:parallel beta-helix repeat protein